MNWPKIDIECPTANPVGTKIFIDGREIKGVRRLTLNAQIDEIVTVTIEVIPQSVRLLGNAKIVKRAAIVGNRHGTTARSERHQSGYRYWLQLSRAFLSRPFKRLALAYQASQRACDR